MSPAHNIDLSDERLVAYIDGELSASDQEMIAEALMRDAAARERLGVLKSGGRPFADAFDVLLGAAPDARLQAMLSDMIGKRAGRAPTGGGSPQGSADGNVVPLHPRRSTGGMPFWRMAAAAAILAFVFAGGLATGGFFEEPAQVGGQQPGWREAASRYVALFSKETLEYMPSDAHERQANLQRVETALGLPKLDQKVESPELAFQGTQLLQLDGKPLAQIAYLYGGQTPVAFCIIRSDKPQAAPSKEKRHGLNIVHWIAGGYGYMVIGDVPEPELDRIAQSFKARFS